jgi:hypothetical protein
VNPDTGYRYAAEFSAHKLFPIYEIKSETR